MRKTIIDSVSEMTPHSQDNWLDVESLARVEISSEEAAHPIESALIPGRGPGWRAAQPGKQTIRVVFDRPLKLTRIRLTFDEQEQARTQEFALRWLAAGQNDFREIVRQQYTFSPPGTIEEVEDYHVELQGVSALELNIVPDISGGSARASLAQISLA
jgi:hypothetical protein